MALLSIKKEITTMQKNELSKLQSSLLQLQHQYDQLHTSNNLNERQLKSVQVSFLTVVYRYTKSIFIFISYRIKFIILKNWMKLLYLIRK